MRKKKFTNPGNHAASLQEKAGKMTTQSLSSGLAMAAALLMAGTASAQMSQTRCYSSYMRGQYRSNCVTINTSSQQRPAQPSRPHYASREEVAIKPAKPALPATAAAAAAKPDANFCGVGYKMTADGCAPAGAGK